MEVVIQQNEIKSQILHDYLKQTYSPALVNHLLQTENYLQQELNDFKKVNEESDQLEELILEQKTAISKTVKQLIDKIQSEQDKMKKAETYKKGKKDELSAIQKAIDSISTAMKETCSKIDIKELNKIGQLPQGMDQFMGKLFSIVYNEDQSKFNWIEFKKKVFDQDKGSDMQSRLANFQFKGVNQEKENLLLQMKADPQFQKVFQDPKYTRAFLDIADWISFVVSGIETQKKKDLVHQEFDRIDKEFSARKVELESYQKTFEFWNSQLIYSENQLIFLNKLKPNIKQIESDIYKSKQNLDIHVDKYLTEIKKMNDLFQKNI
ncbi:unnamed protein product [Paramecium primaurelia]|uniref:Uncharacterized protein n=1 Tax=Paramecium primaurelia TaxID=5886 RepID=A0A8S1PGM5_PARPR|nr:unnamed protein product [Paramecium primaurelia]